MRALLLLALFLTGCAQLPPVPPAGAKVQQCCVCRDRRDFDCLTVVPTARTPHAAYAGRTHYFCSGGCEREFVRQPARFWPAR